MTMPKKGTRKIVVDGKEYKYKVSGETHHWYGGIVDTNLTIELGENNYYTEIREDGWIVKPNEVRQIIEREIEK